MKKPVLIASAKPKHPEVKCLTRTFIFNKIRSRHLTEDQTYVALMKQVAKVSLRMVQSIFTK